MLMLFIKFKVFNLFKIPDRTRVDSELHPGLSGMKYVFVPSLHPGLI